MEGTLHLELHYRYRCTECRYSGKKRKTSSRSASVGLHSRLSRWRQWSSMESLLLVTAPACQTCLPKKSFPLPNLFSATVHDRGHQMYKESGFLEKIGLKKTPEPRELVRKWQADIRKEQRGIERQIVGPCVPWPAGNAAGASVPASLCSRQRLGTVGHCRHTAGAEEGGEAHQGCSQAERYGVRQGELLCQTQPALLAVWVGGWYPVSTAALALCRPLPGRWCTCGRRCPSWQ